MNPKRFFLTLLLSQFVLIPAQGGNTGWIRKSSISPDGKTIAFSYQGDIWTVGVEGGNAVRLTTNPAFETSPLWTPDGKEVVFVSTREDSDDIWAVPACGGKVRRITTFQGTETPLAISPEGKVIFLADIDAGLNPTVFPNTTQTYSVSLQGGKPEQMYPFKVNTIDIAPDGKILYEDYKGVEDNLRKHHTSSVTHDVWLVSGGDFTKLSSFEGEDRNPLFNPVGEGFYYLSEQGGNFNVWKGSFEQGKAPVQLSFLPTHPVRNLSVSSGGTMLFSYNGDLYTMREGGEPAKVDITINADSNEREMVNRSILGGISAVCPSASGKEVAVVAHGDVFVSAVDFKATARVTNTPCQERGVSFAPDGRTLYYASERDGHWGIWRSSLVEKEDEYFSLSFNFKEEKFTKDGQTCFQPAVSPDGKWVAFLRDRKELVIKNTSTGAERSLSTLINYSYSDGDVSFAWSPDSRYILSDHIGKGGYFNPDVSLINIESGEIVDLTQSGYSDENFKWVLGGKAMTWQSDKNGFRSHGSWGSEEDIFIMFFDPEAYAEFALDENEGKIQQALNPKKKGKDKDKDADSTKVEKVEKLKIEIEGREDRTVLLTPAPGKMRDYALSPDGKKLYYCVYLEKGYDLCCRDLKSGSVKVLEKGVSGNFVVSQDGKYAYSTSLLGVSRLDLSSGSRTSISFSGSYEYRAAKEREYIFDHIWRQINDKFYDKNLHGVDWEMMRDNYRAFLPYIDNNRDFADMLSELLGELNASHTGARCAITARRQARLGVVFDPEYKGEGLKILEVLPESVLAVACPGVKAGDTILAVDGKEVEKDALWYEALDRKGGKRTVLTIKTGGKKVNVALTPETSDSDNLYKKWVRSREEMVKSLSGGKIGYVHVEGMDSESFRGVYSKALGKYRNCDALIVDTRHNHGGWLHDDLASFLSGKPYVEFRPRGEYIATEPFSKWTKPSCVLVCEDDYSDASAFPFVYRFMGLGKIIGTPVPGTMTAVWWETQIDKNLVFGVPQITSWSLQDDRPLENLQLEPDIYVENDPASVLRGEDRQLEAAVKHLLDSISSSME